MTIQLLQTWAGKPAGIYTLDPGEESRLIGLGLARAYVLAMDGTAGDGAGEAVIAATTLPIAAAAGAPVMAGMLLRDPATGLIYGQSDGAGGYDPLGAAQPQAVANQIGFASMMPCGLSVNTNGNKQLCSFVKLTAPGEFWAVRVIFRNHSTDAAGATLYGCVVAATETSAHTDKSTTGALTFQPRVGGASVNTLDSSADAYGWRTVTWGGSSTPTVAAATSSTQPTVARSDWIPLRSVARIDSGETLPLLLLRFGYNNTTAATASYIATGSTGIDRTTGNMGRVIQAYFVTDATGVYTTAPQSNTPSSGFNDTMATVGVEFMLVRQARSIWFIGDSTVGGNTIPADKFNTWGWQACAILQDTYGVAAVPSNYGYASQTAATYWDKNAKQYLATHKPHIAVYQVCGHNDYSGATTAALARVITQRCMGKALEFVNTCRENGILPVLLTSVGDSSITTAAADAERLALNTAIKAMPVPYIDMAALLDDTASPARIKSAYNNGDNIHPNIAGIAAQGVEAARVLSGLL